VGFPIAFYTATLVTLLVHASTGDPFWFRAALTLNVAGLVMAVAAVIPGAIDLFSGIPAETPARRTGVRHAAFNVVANVMFLLSAIFLWRAWDAREVVDGRVVLESAAPILFSLVGIAAMLVAGWLGWQLVQKHHVGVEPGPDLDVDDRRIHGTLPGQPVGPPPVTPDDRGVGPTGLH